MIIIIGAGLAGLTCAKTLVNAGQQVRVLEAVDQVGGRLRTDYHPDGYRLDRGFQVLFTAYPAATRHLDFTALKQRKFEPGAILVRDRKHYSIADPLREPTLLAPSLFNPLLSPLDKMRILRLRLELSRLSAGDIFSGVAQPEGQDESTEAYLRRKGFSKNFLDNFARPFYGGIFLDRSLQTSARMFQFVSKMLATGDIILPAEGIQRVPEQIAFSLPRGTVRCSARVGEILLDGGQVQGVRLTSGEKIEGSQVVIATSSPVAAKFLQQPLPTEPVGAVCVYFAGDERLYAQRKILLNTNPDAYVNNAVLLTNIAPTYAPPRKHLLSATVLGNPAEDDAAVAERCRAEISQWFPDYQLHNWQLLAVYRIPFAQFAQPAGVYDTLPDNRTEVEGLFLAGEYTKSSSIQGAIHSGEHAAREVLKTPVPIASSH
jgi:phytoene dehydrogenase-like protein